MSQRRRIRNQTTGELQEPVAPLGPAMRALGSDRQREFVRQLFVGDDNYAAAAARAGYRAENDHSLRQMAYTLSRDPKILAAVKEEVDRHVSLSAAMATAVITSIAANPDAKDRDRLLCCERLLDQGGYSVRQTRDINVTVNDAAMVREIRQFAQQLGIDPKVFLGNAAMVIEHEDAAE
jgi:hypothetical protein